MDKSVIGTKRYINPRFALQTISFSQFIFSSTNGLTVAAMVLLILAYIAATNVTPLSLWYLIPLGVGLLITTLASFYRIVRTNELGATFAEWRGVSHRKYKVLRRGMNEMNLKASRLIPGDLILLNKSDIVPVDSQMVSGSAKVNEGHSIVDKVPASKASNTAGDLGIENFLFKGSRIVEGSAKCLVVFAGDHGPGGNHEDTTLQRDLKYFYKRVLALTGVLCLLFGLLGQWAIRNNEAEYSFADKGSIVLVIVAGVVISSVPLLFTLILVFGLGFTERAVRRKYGVFTSQLDLLTSFASLDAIMIGCADLFVPASSRRITDITPVNTDSRADLAEAIRATLGAHDSAVDSWLDNQNCAKLQDDVEAVPLTIDRGACQLIRGDFVCGLNEDVQTLCGVHAQPSEDVLELGFAHKKSYLGKLSFSPISVDPTTRQAVSLFDKMGIQLVPAFHSENIFFSSRHEVKRLLSELGLYEDGSAPGDGLVRGPSTPSPQPVEANEDNIVTADDDTGSDDLESEECLVPDGVLNMIQSGLHVALDGGPKINKLIEGRQLSLYPGHNLVQHLHEGHIGFLNLNMVQKLRLVVSLKHARPAATIGFLGANQIDRMAILAAHIGMTTEVGLSRACDVLIAHAEEDSLPMIARSVLEARKCFSNLRRALMYLISQIVPRLSPLLLTLAFAYPLALSVPLIIAGSLVIDLPVAAALLRDPPEYDLPFRRPRGEFQEKLVSQRMILIGVAFLGVLGTLSGFLGYCQSFFDYGFNPRGLAGFQSAGFVLFDQTTSSEPGFPPTVGYPLDLTLTVLDNVHLCGRVGNALALSPSGLSAVAIGDRCGGQIFTLDKYNQFCYTKMSSLASYTSSIQDAVGMYVQQKSVSGVLFQRDTAVGSEGLPTCTLQSSDGIYIPYGFYTDGSQAIIDKSMSGSACSAIQVIDEDYNLPVCFTNKAIKTAQSVYFASTIFFALCSAILILRTELFSFFHISVINRNYWVLIACAVSLTLTLLAVYLAPLQNILGTRSIDSRNLLSPSAPFIIIAFGLEEVRKLYIRRRTTMGHWLMQRTMW